MAYISPFLPTRRAVRAVQPQGAVGIDWSNPITRGLTFVSGGELSQLQFPSRQMGASTGPTQGFLNGRSIKSIGSGKLPTGVYASDMGITGAAARTVFVEYDHPDFAVSSSLLAVGGNTATTRCYWALDFQVGSFRTISLHTFSDDHNITLWSAASTSARVRLALSYDGNTTCNVYATAFVSDGTKVVTKTSFSLAGVLATGNTSPLDILGGGPYGEVSAPSGVNLYGMMFWNRCVSDAEAVSLNANPYQIFRNQALLAAPSIAPRAPVTPRQSFWMGTTSPTPSTASMAGLVNSTARTKQPTQGFSALNLSNDITKGIAAAVVPSAGYRELTGKQPIIVGGSGVGIYGNNSGSLSAGPFWAWPVGAVSSSVYTMLVVGEFVPTNGAILVSVANITGTGYKFCFSPTGGNIGITHYGTADYTFGVASPASGCIAVSGAANSTASLWVNGANLANIAVGGITAASSPAFSVGGRYNASDATSASKIYLAVLWNRVLSPAELASVTANPWQIFAPVAKPVWVKT